MQNSFTYEPHMDFNLFEQLLLANELFIYCQYKAKRFNNMYLLRDPDGTFLVTLSIKEDHSMNLMVVITEGEDKGRKVFVCEKSELTPYKDTAGKISIKLFEKGPWINRLELLMGCKEL